MSGFISKGRHRFIRHRDITNSEKEIKKEKAVLQKTLEGVCTKCQEKLLWRFRYDKYKSITKIATCQSCKQKCITKAYRTFCDPCSVVNQVCPGCCCLNSDAIRMFGRGDKGIEDLSSKNGRFGVWNIADIDDRMQDTWWWNKIIKREFKVGVSAVYASIVMYFWMF